jgi:hypothetical protein
MGSGSASTCSPKLIDIEEDSIREESMTAPTFTAALTMGELEASYPLYCKALRMLIRDGVTRTKASRTVAWSRLETLHHSLSRQYRHPEQLFFLLSREVQDQKTRATAA